MQVNFFFKKRLRALLVFAFLVSVTYGGIMITEYDVIKGFSSIPMAISWGVTNFFPTTDSFEHLPKILISLWETILLSIGSATLASLFALFFAILGSNTTTINPFFATICRFIATLFRNIDVAVWSMILLFSFGQSALTGYFALFFVSFGFLTRAFIETIDEVSNSGVEALRATGASYISIVIHSVIPSSASQMLSWLLFMIETNIRSATLIGILTGTGIGFVFDLYYKSVDYNTASLVVIAIVIAILALEAASNYVRRVII
ncbi:phosphonate ABC transporter permease [Gracilibacillus halophilus YIM-C55.5]|uniref:Phosphonate ABC transporter permease n=1 Tax=Gracilibacillus halophilus YIM-C55.5 TaxID=1308866 RepID=N4W5X8_9BACI|nr:ABC transporter permease subunit [Gracilibacillus halophilus]ENH95593.1 phosphonate ABC transporter permease [Gracilibacillus halophilus YIM-C55.5]